MIISGVVDESCGCNVKSRSGAGDEDGNDHDYQTADRLFEIFKHNECSTGVEGDTPSKGDVFLLYKNIEMGTEEPPKEFKCRPHNQYVETVVYKDDSDDSDLSQNYSNDDLMSIFEVNSERIDFFSRIPSGNTLCNKLGNMELQTSFLMSEYCLPFLKDPFARDPFDHINLLSKIDNLNVLPTSLIDYIACKRMEDHFNFCMDDIIRYVQFTIDQLKRISNGEFLTDTVKEKWLQVENCCDKNSKKETVLAACTTIPLHVERKTNSAAIKWDDLVKSDADVKSLSKVLEKRIVAVPQLLQGSFKMFSKRCGDNLIIRFKRDDMKSPLEMLKDSRIDVILNLRRSTSGRVLSDITSTITLKRPLWPRPLSGKTEYFRARLPLKLKVVENVAAEKEFENNKKSANKQTEQVLDSITKVFADDEKNGRDKGSTELDPSNEHYSPRDMDYYYSTAKSPITNELLMKNSQRFSEIVCDIPDNKREEIGDLEKKTSEPRIRYKSPYENKSHQIEERKRRKLLEIRDRREKKKQALELFGQIFKNGFNKGASKPQSSNSVTTLSITNKAFYNSIYGASETSHKSHKKNKKLNKTEESSDETDYSSLCTEINESKYINRSFYLDDIETGIMQTECKAEANALSMAGDSSVDPDKRSKEKKSKAKVFIDLKKTPSFGNQSRLTNSPTASVENVSYPVSQCEVSKCDEQSKNVDDDDDIFSDESAEKISPLKFKKSIDKIYGLLKKFDNTYSKNSSGDTKNYKAKSIQNAEPDNAIVRENIIKKFPRRKNDQIDLPEETTFGFKTFDKNIGPVRPLSKVQLNNMITKLNASPDIQLQRNTEDTTVEVNATKDTPPKNTLEIDKAQRRRNKTILEKSEKRLDQAKPLAVHATPTLPSKLSKSSKYISANIPKMDKPLSHRKLLEMSDEQREARGEAVRGPPISSRLDELAQPKKAYLMATKDESNSKPLRSDRQRKLQKPRRMALESDVRQSVPLGKKQIFDNTTPKSDRRPASPPALLQHTMMRLRVRAPAAATARSPSPTRPKKLTAASRDNLNTLNIIEGKPFKLKNKKRSVSPRKSIETAERLQYIEPNLLKKTMFHKKLITSETHSSFSSLLSALDSAVQHYNMKEDTTDILSTTFENAEYQNDFDDSDNLNCDRITVEKLETGVSNKTSENQNIIDKPHHIIEQNNEKKQLENNEVTGKFDAFVEYDANVNNDSVDNKNGEEKNIKNHSENNTEVLSSTSGDHELENTSNDTRHCAVMQSRDAATLVVKSKVIKCLRNPSLSGLNQLAKLSHLSWSMSSIPANLPVLSYVFNRFNALKQNSPTKKIKISSNNSLIKFNNVNRVRIQNFVNSKQFTCIANKTNDKNKDIISRNYENGTYVKILTRGIDIGINTSSLGIKSYDMKMERKVPNKYPIKTIMELVPTKAVSSPSIVETIQTRVETMSTLVNPNTTIENSISTLMGPIPIQQANKFNEITSYKDSALYTESNQDNSLDILMGLLTEIQNITHSCHICISNPLSQISTKKSNGYEIESILDNRLNTLNRSPSVISIYVSDNCKVAEKSTSITSIHLQQSEVMDILTSFEDKAIDAASDSVCQITEVDFDEKSLDNLNKDSTISINACNFYLPQVNDTSYINNEVETCINNEVETCINNEVETCINNEVETCINNEIETCINNEVKIIDVTEVMSEPTAPQIDTKPIFTKKVKTHPKQRNLMPLNHCRLYKSQINMKRDILVTVYSILVVTVFAALSFPGLT